MNVSTPRRRNRIDRKRGDLDVKKAEGDAEAAEEDALEVLDFAAGQWSRRSSLSLMPCPSLGRRTGRIVADQLKLTTCGSPGVATDAAWLDAIKDLLAVYPLGRHCRAYRGEVL